MKSNNKTLKKPNDKTLRLKDYIILANGGLLSSLKGVSADAVGGVALGGLDLVNNITDLVKPADTSGIEKSIKAHSQTTSNALTNEQLMQEWANMSNMLNVTAQLAGVKSGGNILGGALKGAASGAAIGSVIPGLGTAIGAAVGGIGSTIAGLIGRNRAKKKQQALNKQVLKSNLAVFDNLSNRVDTIDKKNDFGMASNYFSMGGQVHPLFSNGVSHFGSGGTHELNPLRGIPVSIDPQGKPNLAEEGEVKFNDYIFSNRLKPTKNLLPMFGLKNKKASFADIAKSLSKESEERPNDVISKRGLEDSMMKLMMALDAVKPKEEESNVFAGGGPLNVEDPLKKGIDTLNKAKYINPYDTNWSINKYATVDNPLLRGINSLNNLSNLKNIIASAHGNNKSRASWAENLRYAPVPSWAENLRYAPVLGGAYSVFSDAMGWSNKPDYSRIDSISSTPVAPKPIGNYLTYNPLDREYHLNKLNAQAAASRNAIINLSGGNRAVATAGLLAADYNALNQTGDMARRAEEYNMLQKHAVEGFNRQTNMFNSQQALQADIHNSQQGLRELMFKAQMYQNVDDRTAQAKSLNLTNLFDNIGEVGRESFARNMIVTNPALYYTIDSRGRISYKNTEGLNNNQLQYVKQHAEEEARKHKQNDSPAYMRGYTR